MFGIGAIASDSALRAFFLDVRLLRVRALCTFVGGHVPSGALVAVWSSDQSDVSHWNVPLFVSRSHFVSFLVLVVQMEVDVGIPLSYVLRFIALSLAVGGRVPVQGSPTAVYSCHPLYLLLRFGMWCDFLSFLVSPVAIPGSHRYNVVGHAPFDPIPCSPLPPHLLGPCVPAYGLVAPRS